MKLSKEILLSEILRMAEGFKTLNSQLEDLILKQETEGMSLRDYKKFLFLLEQQNIGMEMLIRDANNLSEIERGENNDA